jgi:predicted transposase/invertase (TIGR01784 family)
MKKINTPHDKYFRTMLSNKDVAKDFLEWHLPDFIKKKIDLDTVEAKKDSFVDDNFKKLETDILFSLNFNDKPGYIYTLVEAQKKPDRLMPIRLLKYLIAIMEHHIKNNEDKQLPTIYPLILYQGKALWNHSTNFFALFLEPDLVKQILTNDFQLVDIHRIPDSEFGKHFLSGVFEACIKWGATRDIINTLDVLKPDLIKILNLNKGALVAILTYLGDVGNTDVETLIEWGKNAGSVGEEVMALRQELEQIGEDRGFEKGVKKTALKMIKEKADLKFISKVTDLPVKEIEELQAQNQEKY